MTDDPRTDPEFHGPTPKPVAPRPRWYLRVALGLAGIGLLTWSVLIACHNFLCEDVCIVNLKLISLALEQYNSTYGALPPQYTVDADGRPLHSWRTLILPYLEQRELYESIDLTKPWNDPANARAFETRVRVYHCPASKGPPNTTTYLAIVAPGGWCLPERPRRLDEFADGPSNTLMLIEGGEKSAVPWMAPSDADESLIMGLGSISKTNHWGKFFAAFADTSIHSLKDGLPPETRRALLTIAGGEAISADDD